MDTALGVIMLACLLGACGPWMLVGLAIFIGLGLLFGVDRSYAEMLAGAGIIAAALIICYVFGRQRRGA